MIKASMGPPKLEKHTFPKQAYRKYETWNTNTKPPKPNSLEKKMKHNPP
jgi:hypothetical protein